MTDDLGSILLSVVTHAEERRFSEIETRVALQAALKCVMFYFLWTGEDEAEIVPNIDGELDPTMKYRDMPPALIGYMIAQQRIEFSANISEGSLYDDFLDNCITNAWTGDRRERTPLGRGAPPPEAPVKDQASPGELPGELVGEEEAARLFRPAVPFWFSVNEARRTRRVGRK